MKKVYCARDLQEASMLESLLKDRGVEIAVIGETLLPLAGRIGASAYYPELWVVRDEDERPALKILREYEAGRAGSAGAGEPWKCPRCGGINEAQFDECWKCAAEDGDEPEGERENPP